MYERGDGLLTPEELDQIRKALHVEVERLIEEFANEPEVTAEARQVAV